MNSIDIKMSREMSKRNLEFEQGDFDLRKTGKSQMMTKIKKNKEIKNLECVCLEKQKMFA